MRPASRTRNTRALRQGENTEETPVRCRSRVHVTMKHLCWRSTPIFCYTSCEHTARDSHHAHCRLPFVLGSLQRESRRTHSPHTPVSSSPSRITSHQVQEKREVTTSASPEYGSGVALSWMTVAVTVCVRVCMCVRF